MLSDTVVVRVNPIFPLPMIVTQTTNLALYLGETGRLAVVIAPSFDSNAVPTVTWQKDGFILPEAKRTDFVILSANPGDAGLYVAKIQEPGGTVLSAPMTVEIAAWPIVTARRGVAGVSVSFPALFGRDYLLEAQPSIGGAWTIEQTLTPKSVLAESDLSAEPDTRLFRIRLVPLP